MARRLVIEIASAVLLSGVSLVALNATIDPFKVFDPAAGPADHRANDRYARVARLIQTPEPFDVLVMGSSVSGILDPVDVAHALGHDTGFNAALVNGTPGDALSLLKILETNGRLPRHVVYGLDPVPFDNPVTGTAGLQARFPSPDGTPSLADRLDFLTAPPTEALGRLIDDGTPMLLLRPDTGQFTYPQWDADIDRDAAAYQKRLDRLRLAPPGTLQAQHFEDLAALEAFLEEQGISATFFFSPVSTALESNLTAEGLAEFRERASSVLNTLVLPTQAQPEALHPVAFYDATHYRPSIASRVVVALAPDRLATSNPSSRL